VGDVTMHFVHIFGRLLVVTAFVLNVTVLMCITNMFSRTELRFACYLHNTIAM